MNTEKEKTSYLIGLQVAGNLLAQGVDLDIDSFSKGITGGFNQEPCEIPPEEANALLQKLEAGIKEKLQKQRMEAAMANKKAGEDFLAENGNKDGITTTESGLQYKVIAEGDGAIPTATDTVPVVLAPNAPVPTATFEVPVATAPRALTPIAIL